MLTNTIYTKHSGFHSFTIDTDDYKECQKINSWCLSRFSLDYNIVNIHHPEISSDIIRFTVVITNHDAADSFAKTWTTTN